MTNFDGEGLETLHLAVDHGVATLTLTRASRMNAINLAMRLELKAVFQELTANPVDVLIITGAGRAFCAGGDVDEFRTRTVEEAIDVMTRISHVWFRSLWQLPCPVIAAINGVAAGGGLSLALAADLVYAAESSEFVCSFGSLGLTADLGALYLLPRLIGLRRSQEVALSGRRIGPQEALDMGLVTAVVPDEELTLQAMKKARELQKSSRAANAATKRLLQRSYESSMDEMLAHELYAQAYLFGTEEHRLRIDRFVEKRQNSRFE